MTVATAPAPTPTTDRPPPADMAGIVRQGSQALQDGDLAAALDLFHQVVQAFPQRPEGHNNLGALYSALGETAKAEACFDRVLALLPDNANVLYNRGLVRARQEKFAAARADFQAVVELSPHDCEARNNLGVLEYRSGRPDHARRHLQEALAQRPDYAAALLNLCDLEAQEGALAQAMDLCRRFLASHADAKVGRRLLELQIGSCLAAVDEACGHAEDLLRQDAQDVATRQDLGRLIQARSALTPPPA